MSREWHARSLWGVKVVEVEDKGRPASQALPAREKNLVTFLQHVHPQAAGVDVSQAISRMVKTVTLDDGRIVLPTLTTSTKMFLLPRARMLNGHECLLAQGFPAQDPSFARVLEKVPQRLLHDLAGNAMSSTVCFAVFSAMVLAVPWADAPEEDSDSGPDEEDGCDLSSVLQGFSASSARPAGDSP